MKPLEAAALRAKDVGTKPWYRERRSGPQP